MGLEGLDPRPGDYVSHFRWLAKSPRKRAGAGNAFDCDAQGSHQKRKPADKEECGYLSPGQSVDGACGMLEMKQAGVLTFAQDEATCVVFGMTKEAIKLGGVERVLPLQDVAPAIL
jgi:hypothetical protein